MTWALPAAWALAAAVVLPIVAHLWSRRTPRAVAFPTLRFLRAASPVSRRLRTIQDWPLLLLRLTLVLAVAAAAAGPTVATPARAARRQARLHRVIVVQDAAASGTHDSLDAELGRLRDGASSSTVLRTGSWESRLRSAQRSAAAAASQQRTEVVVLWDGTRRHLSSADLAPIPAVTGIRLQPWGAAGEAAPSFGPDAISRLELLSVEQDAATRAALERSLRALAPAMPRVGITMYWPGTSVRPPAALPSEAAARAALAHLSEDARVAEAATRSRRDPRADAFRPPLTAVVLARTLDGASLLRGWTDGGRLVLAVDAEPASPVSLWAVIAALDASADADTWADPTPAGRWAADEIAAATREPQLPSDARLPGGLDTRLAWLLVLGLIGLEEGWRRRQARRMARADEASTTGALDDAA